MTNRTLIGLLFAVQLRANSPARGLVRTPMHRGGPTGRLGSLREDYPAYFMLDYCRTLPTGAKGRTLLRRRGEGPHTA